MAKLVFFPWYPAEAAIDSWWMSLSLQEQAVHFRLLSFAWVNGGLNKDLTRVAAQVGLTREEFNKHWPAVAEKWALNGLLVVNKRQEQERLKVATKSEINAAAGRASAAARAAKSVEVPLNVRSTSVGTECQQRASDSDSLSSSISKSSFPEGSVRGTDLAVTSMEGFSEWFPEWSSVRGNNHESLAGMAWLSHIHDGNRAECFKCMRSYLAGVGGNTSGGFNPENFIADQARDGFKARWPKRASNGLDRKARASADFEARMLEEISAKGIKLNG